MASLFGGPFGHIGSMGQNAPTPASPPNPAGGFPGIFPGGGVSNSGWAGLNQFRPPCTPNDVRTGVCVRETVISVPPVRG